MCFFLKNLASQRNGVNSDTSYYFAGPQRWRGRIEPRCKRAFYTGWKPWGVAESRQVGFQLHLLLLLRFGPWGRTGSGEGCSPCHCVACGCPSPEPVVIINFFLPSLIPMASCATLTLLYHTDMHILETISFDSFLLFFHVSRVGIYFVITMGLT